MKKKYILLIVVSLLFSVANAKQQRPVKHAHNGKSHTHILPNNGIGKHNHKGNHNTKGAFYNKNVAHMHNGRKHSHVLPNGRKNHNHGGSSKKKTTYTPEKTISINNGIRTVSKKYKNGDRYVGHMDKNGKRHGKGTYFWSDGEKYVGNWKNDKEEGKGIRYLTNGSNYSGQWEKGKKNGLMTVTLKSGYTDTDMYKNGKPYGKINKDLIKFAKANSYSSLVSSTGNDVKASWSRKDAKKGTLYFGGINSFGTIELDLPNGWATVSGKFRQGLLIGDGTLKVRSSKCYDRGFIFCKVSESGSYQRKITSSSNIKKLIEKDLSKVRSQMYDRASKRIASNRSSSSSSSSSSNSSIPYVMITFDSVCGFALCSDKNLSISGGPGSFSPSFSGSDSGAIHKGYNGLAGTYNWSAEFDNNRCSGSFRLSGVKRNLTISSDKSCDTTYNEY